MAPVSKTGHSAHGRQFWTVPVSKTATFTHGRLFHGRMKNNWHGAADRIGLWAASGAVFPAAAVPVTGPEGGCGTEPEAKPLTHCTLLRGPVPDNCKSAAGSPVFSYIFTNFAFTIPRGREPS